MPRAPKLDAFTRAYIEAMLWSTTDESDDQGGEPLDKNYDARDIAPETMELIVEDCADFQKRFGELLADSGIADSRAGFCFWLSRNGHGSGFFDEDSIDEEFQEKLQDAAEEYGTFDLQVDDGVIYGPPADWYRRNRKVTEARRGAPNDDHAPSHADLLAAVRRAWEKNGNAKPGDLGATMNIANAVSRARKAGVPESVLHRIKQEVLGFKDYVPPVTESRTAGEDRARGFVKFTPGHRAREVRTNTLSRRFPWRPR